MGKIRVGIVGDAGVPTGFATVTHNLTRYLKSTGEYEVKIIAINYDGRTDNEYAKEFDMWPARNGGDFLGVGAVPHLFEEFNPDIFFMFQDFWNIPLYLGQAPPGRSGTVAYFPVDAPNIKGVYMLPLAAATAVGCYTEFARKEAVRSAEEAWGQLKMFGASKNSHIVDSVNITVGSNAFDPITRVPLQPKPLRISAHRLKNMKDPSGSGFFVIPHGVDTSSFKPINKRGARKILRLPSNSFIIGNVNRNQSRKRLDIMLRAFKEFAKDKQDVVLVLHCVKTDVQGWDLEQLALYYDVLDKVIFTHVTLKDMTATIEQLNCLYNSFDVQVNCSGGEGWGLTTFEGAAVKVPQIVPDWAATKEIWEGSGLLTKIISVRHEPAQINTMQCVVDTTHLVEQLNTIYENRKLGEEIGEKCFQITQKDEYKWENVGKKFDKVFKDSIGKTHDCSIPVALSAQGQIELIKAMKSGRPRIVNEGK